MSSWALVSAVSFRMCCITACFLPSMVSTPDFSPGASRTKEFYYAPRGEEEDDEDEDEELDPNPNILKSWDDVGKRPAQTKATERQLS